MFVQMNLSRGLGGQDADKVIVKGERFARDRQVIKGAGPASPLSLTEDMPFGGCNGMMECTTHRRFLFSLTSLPRVVGVNLLMNAVCNR